MAPSPCVDVVIGFENPPFILPENATTACHRFPLRQDGELRHIPPQQMPRRPPDRLRTAPKGGFHG
jgi:hypothetical protein